MKISKLRIRNLYGIKEFNLEGQSVELEGKKGVGKSSVIDAIKLALTNKSSREYIIKLGEQEGEVYIQFDSGLSIHRKIRANKADYKSIKQEGEKGDKNESFIREIFTELQLNPIEFSKMDSAEQNRIILDLIDFKWDLNWIKEQFGEIPQCVNFEQNILRVLFDIQKDEGTYFQTRQDKNRLIRDKQAFITEVAATLPKDYNAAKWESVNLGEIYKKIEVIRTKNESIIKAQEKVQSRDTKIKEFQSVLQIENNKIEKIANEKLAEYENTISDIEKEITKTNVDLKITLSNIEKEIANTRTNLEKEIIDLENQIKAKKEKILSLNTEIVSRLDAADKDCKFAVESFKNKIETVKQHIINLGDQKKHQLELKQKTYESNIAEMEGDIKPHIDLAKQDQTPFDDLTQNAEHTEKMKAYINEYKRMVTLQGDVEKLQIESAGITEKIEKARALPGQILATCKIPIDGLSIKDGIPLINSLPISNLSDGEKFELCIKVATRDDNSLQMILLNGIECLSSSDRENIYKTMKERGVQFIASRTTDNEDLTVVEL